MVALLTSLIFTGILVAVVVTFARRRTPGTPLTWGEAFVAGVFVYFILFMVYGVVPHQWLAFADNQLKWRSDKVGIPVGGIGIAHWHLFKKPYLLFPKGVPLPHGHFIITAQVLRDVVAAGLYIVFLVAQILTWLWWQNRGKKKREAIEPVSAYGRPLVRRA